MILILGGTSEARRLAGALGERAIVSLAGRTSDPVTVGTTRRGGFGGVDGLAAYLAEHQVTAVIDATHPFAAGMSRNAVEACMAAGVPLLRLTRPSWQDHPQAAGWRWVDSHDEAALAAAEQAHPVLLTVGRQHTQDYVPALGGHRVVARVTEAAGLALPDGWVLLSSRGPFTLDGERALFAAHGFGAMVTKDAGGPMTEAKLQVAAERGMQVIVVRRPALPPTREVSTVEAALLWAQEQA